MFNIIPKKNIWLSISSVLVGLSLLSLMIWGLNLGIDFTGGALLEVKFLEERPDGALINEKMSSLNLGDFIQQPIGEKGLILRLQDINEEKHQEIINQLNLLVAVNANSDIESQATTTRPIVAGLEQLRFDSVGPTIGQELKNRSMTAIVIVLIAIVLYIAWAFRKVSKPVASWKYGLSALVALFHDVLIVVGIFALLGRFLDIEINAPFIAAILTVLGYSVNDTIVVFDRVRENLPKSDEDFETTVNISVNQTIKRSINTSFTTLVVLLSIVLFGGASIRPFVLALSIGVFIGTYSSIFLASPVLVIWEKLGKK